MPPKEPRVTRETKVNDTIDVVIEELTGTGPTYKAEKDGKTAYGGSREEALDNWEDEGGNA